MAGNVGAVQQVSDGKGNDGFGFTVSGDGSYRFPITVIYNTAAEAKTAREDIQRALSAAVAVTEAR